MEIVETMYNKMGIKFPLIKPGMPMYSIKTDFSYIDIVTYHDFSALVPINHIGPVTGVFSG